MATYHVRQLPVLGLWQIQNALRGYWTDLPCSKNETITDIRQRFNADDNVVDKTLARAAEDNNAIVDNTTDNSTLDSLYPLRAVMQGSDAKQSAITDSNVVLTDKQYCLLLELYHELPNEFSRLSNSAKAAFFKRLYTAK